MSLLHRSFKVRVGLCQNDPCTIHVDGIGIRLPNEFGYVSDAQRAVDEAVKMGAREVTRVTELAFGERVARVRDGQGHLWWMHERVEILDAQEVGRRFGETRFQDAMAYVQQSLVDELSVPAR